ncbi:MAG TPA: hypothetical protein VL282_04625 [Tepidisphaeraceae bacterium]|nr:hypothetical protein [Tepidisphaeraceae bacterium]
MKRLSILVLICLTVIARAEERRISLDDLRNRIRGAWAGKMAGVSWGAKTEFHYLGKIIPENEVPR